MKYTSCPSDFRGATHFSRTSLIFGGILSSAQYRVLDTVSGKNPFFPNKASMVGSKPFPSMPTCQQNKVGLARSSLNLSKTV